MNEIESRILKLREIINEHNHNYYNLDKNLISDFDYDKLLNELINLESNIQNILMKTLPQIELVVVYQISSAPNLIFIKCTLLIIPIPMRN